MSNLLKRCLWSIYFSILLLPTPTQAHAPQEESQGFDEEIDTTYNDDLEPEFLSNYVSLTVKWGINSLLRAPQNMDLIFWRSRVVGANLYYNIPIKSSPFMVSCGADLYNADYLFKDAGYTLDRKKGTPRETTICPASKVIPTDTDAKVQKSELSIWYADFITELRFNSNKEEPQEGFFIAVGGNIGFQFSPATSIRYKEDGEDKTRTIQESFNLAKIRYGMLARMGWRRYGIFYHQTLSPLFNNKGPATPNNKSILPWSVGVSVNLL